MNSSKRSFEAMSVVPSGVESFESRYGKKRRYDYDTPPMKQWRCNLTGLSQIYNLYFVAYGSDIYVYTPQFPTQAIEENVRLVFTSQPSRANLHGYLDQRNPHSINNLIVNFLGNEEVVAVVRDDGDVDAFLVRHILQAIERRAELGNSLDHVADEIRPFFQNNLGMTAWGLAMHTQARILAASSNAREVRVFKFGLLQEADEMADSRYEGPHAPRLQNTSKRKERETDVTYQIINGESNIPCISFCNTGDDPECRWLLTTDISGICRVMDLHELKQVQAFRFGRQFIAPHSGGFDRLNAGWIITFLDRRSFEAEDSVQAAVGMEEGAKLPGIELNDSIWDLSKTVLGLPESSEPFVYVRPRRSELPEASSDIATQHEEGVESSLDFDDEDSGNSDSSEDGGVEIDIEMDDAVSEAEDDVEALNPSTIYDGETQPDLAAAQTESGPNAEAIATAIDYGEAPNLAMSHDAGTQTDFPPMPESEPIAHQTNTSTININHNEDEDEDENVVIVVEDQMDYGSDNSPPLIDDGDDPDDEGTEDSISHTAWYSGGSVRANEPQFIIKNENLCDNLPCPILHASVRNIYLLQPSFQKQEPRPDVPPMVGLANPLRQAVQQDFAYLRLFERLNMVAHIPPLGVVVIASQKGRAIVLSLTKIAGHARHYPPEMQSQAHKTNYGMRVECILPFAHQEKANHRPFAQLHGLAASPLQGIEGGSMEKKRWRIMMMYQDHSVLSYEISKKGRSRDSGVDVGNLVV